ncbi:MAG: sugar phosphate isomerase/epimerase family protein [Promethearchaeota archaeon]
MDVAFNTYSIRKEWDSLGSQDKKIKTVIAICKEMGVEKIEFLDAHFERGDLPAHCKTFADGGIQVYAIGPHVKLLARPNEVEKMVKDGKEWLNAAHDAGVAMVRFQVGDGALPRAFQPMNDFDEEDWEDYNEQMEEAVRQSDPVIAPLIEEAEKTGTHICIETHHSYSSNYVYMKLIEEKYQSKNMGWIFDIGNYENDDMRWKALDVIKGNTKYLHAKAYSFNDEGFEPNLDFPRIARVLHEAGCTGTWSIEFEGNMHGLLGAFKSAELIRYSLAKAEGRDYSMKLDFPSGDELLARLKQ